MAPIAGRPLPRLVDDMRVSSKRNPPTRNICKESLIEKVGVAGQPRRSGAHITGSGVTFNLWAPSAESVELLESGQTARRMPRDGQGWYQALSSTARAGTRYQ